MSWGEWPRSYEAQVREGYLDNAVAQRAVRLVAEGVAATPFSASDDRAGALVRTTSAGQHLLESVAMHLLLHGNAYVELLPGADGAPAELYALRPERVSVEADPRGWPVAFVYKAGGREGMRLAAENVIHIRVAHPLDDHYGLGCLGAASGPVAIHNAAAKWNKALLDNAARPSGALVQEGAEPLSGDQFDRLKAELEAGFAGAANAGRPMLLEGGLRWQTLSLSPADMDFIALKAAAAREIALAFGVPPMLLGLPGDATYANYREANRALWRQAILPLTSKILAALAQGLRPWFAGLSLEVDIDAVPALAEDRERLWAQLGAADFLTLNEKRAAIGLAPVEMEAPPEPEGDPDPPPAGNDNEIGAVEAAEVKFNPNHDPENGRFTFGNGGSQSAGSASFTGGSQMRGRQGARRAAAGSAGPGTKPGGGSFGGGGASESYSDAPSKLKPAVRPAKPIPAAKPQVRLASIRMSQPAANPLVFKPTPPSLPKTQRITDNGYDFDLDEQGRTRMASGQLKIDREQARSRANQLAAGGSNRETDDQGGHYIARVFAGPRETYNHFAQNKGFNNGGYRRLENSWLRTLESGGKVFVRIESSYPEDSKRPNTITVFPIVNGREAKRRIFPNSIESKSND